MISLASRPRQGPAASVCGSGRSDAASLTHPALCCTLVTASARCFLMVVRSQRSGEDGAGKVSRSPGIVVFCILRDAVCEECGAELSRGSFLHLKEGRPLCLSCADLDRLVFLPAGDATLTRRANSASTLKAVVVRFSRSRKRYERQGSLVEEEALARAEQECLTDAEARERARSRAAQRRQEHDAEYVAAFAGRLGELFPGSRPPRGAPSRSMPARSTPGESAARRPRRSFAPRPSFWRSGHTSVTRTLRTTSCWRGALTGTRPALASLSTSRNAWAGGKARKVDRRKRRRSFFGRPADEPTQREPS